MTGTMHKPMVLEPDEVQLGDLVERLSARGVWRHVTDIARFDTGQVVLYLAPKTAAQFNTEHVWRTARGAKISVLREVSA